MTPPTDANQADNHIERPKSPVLDQILRMFMLFALVNLVRNNFFPQSKSSLDTVSITENSSTNQLQTHTPTGKVSCVWPLGSSFDMRVDFADDVSINYTDNCQPANQNDIDKRLAGFSISNLIYGSDLTKITNLKQNTTIPLSKAIIFNETNLYAHVCLNLHDAERKGDVFTKTFVLTKYKLRKRRRDEKMLLGDEVQSEVISGETKINVISNYLDSPLYSASSNRTHDQILLFINPTLSLQLISNLPPFVSKHSIPSSIGVFMDWSKEENTSNQYYPLLYHSEFWTRRDMLLEINGTLDHINVEFNLNSVPLWKWQMMSSMEITWKQNESSGKDDGGSDMLRKMLLETNPILLFITVIVSILHTIFDCLAFKNDVAFFKGNKSMEGLSLRSMVVNTGFQIIIFLYLADNDTSFMVLASNAVGLCIEIWKISKAVKVSVFDIDGGIRFQWKEDSTYSNSKTKEYDEIATSHLLYITMPLVSGYGIYSLLHQRHKSWYSWVLNTLVGFIYMFGFVMMTPQLFINYKLQSVAHLNWRTLTYKSINTFIDDLFAFVIKMPIMHRLACLRDDVIFFIYLYQRFKYRTDYSRVNEFGQCTAPTDEMKEMMDNGKDKNDSDNMRIQSNETKAVRRGARDK